MRLTDVLALSHVPRWAIVPHVQPQSVADHTFRVVAIARELAKIADIELTANDLWYMLNHDAAESRSGDANRQFKHMIDDKAWRDAEEGMCPWLVQEPIVTTKVENLLKVADAIEAMTFIQMYGAGKHADSVARLMKREIVATYTKLGIDVMKVEKLIVNILREEGR